MKNLLYLIFVLALLEQNTFAKSGNCCSVSTVLSKRVCKVIKHSEKQITFDLTYAPSQGNDTPLSYCEKIKINSSKYGDLYNFLYIVTCENSEVRQFEKCDSWNNINKLGAMARCKQHFGRYSNTDSNRRFSDKICSKIKEFPVLLLPLISGVSNIVVAYLNVAGIKSPEQAVRVATVLDRTHYYNQYNIEDFLDSPTEQNCAKRARSLNYTNEMDLKNALIDCVEPD